LSSPTDARPTAEQQMLGATGAAIEVLDLGFRE